MNGQSCLNCWWSFMRYDYAIDELKNLKAELKGESDFTGAGHLVVEWETIEKLIDERISKLEKEKKK